MNREMILDRIPRSYCEGPFWGNGKMGAVMHFNQERLCISVDHVSLWELRETMEDEPRQPFSELLKNPEKVGKVDLSMVAPTRIFGEHIGRTKLPALAVELVLPGKVTGFSAATDLGKAITQIELQIEDGSKVTGSIWLDSCMNVLCLSLQGEAARGIELHALGWNLESEKLSVLKRWGYEACTQNSAGDMFTMTQNFGGDKTAVLSGCKQSAESRVDFTVSIATGRQGEQDELAAAGKALTEDYMEHQKDRFRAHCADWERYWSKSGVSVPHEQLQEAYDIEMYKLYCNERPDSLPVTLQGVWNPNDRMPAWYGDLHNDLNVQACYWPAYKTGNVEFVQPYIDYYAAAIPRFQIRAEKLFGIPGAIHVPTMMTPEGTGAASEWCVWNILLGAELYVSTDFCWYYNYSNDVQRLKEKIMPFLKGVFCLYKGIAYEEEDGYLHIPMTCSPEIHTNGGIALKPDSTFILSTLHYVLNRMAEYAAVTGDDSSEWIEFERRLAPVVPTENGLPLFPDMEVFESHRHFCQMFPVYPLGEENHNELASMSLDTVVNKGFLEYAAFSFPYMSIFASRCGRGNMARTMLEIYCSAFRSRNSFTINGDFQRNGLLHTKAYVESLSDAFTLEAGFMVPAAMCEMLVHRSKETVWLLAGIPDEWKKCSCSGLTVEGGHKVSIWRENYHISRMLTKAGKDETLNFQWEDGAALKQIYLNGAPMAPTAGSQYRITLHKGDELELIYQ